MQVTRQETDVTISVKNASKAPVITAPIILVAANVIARRTTANKIVPRIPVRATRRFEHIQARADPFWLVAAVISNTAR